MNTIGRRTFLGGLVAAPGIYGLTQVLGQDKGPAAAGDPEWLIQALSRMKETERWGVVIVAPAAEDARRSLGMGLYALTELDDEDVDAHDLFSQAVFVVLSESQVRSRFPKVDGKPDRILLDPAGNPLVWDATGVALYMDSAKFSTSFRSFIHGADGGRLTERAKAIEGTMPEHSGRRHGTWGPSPGTSGRRPR